MEHATGDLTEFILIFGSLMIFFLLLGLTLRLIQWRKSHQGMISEKIHTILQSVLTRIPGTDESENHRESRFSTRERLKTNYRNKIATNCTR
jgi:hypothetical protein